MKIWFRVGMEADVTAEELKKLKSGDEKLAKEIIKRAELGGDTYVPDCDYNEGVYEDGEKYIEFLF